MPVYLGPTPKKKNGRSVRVLQAATYIGIGGMMLLGAGDIIQPGETGLIVTLKRTLAAVLLSGGSYLATKLAIEKGAPAAADGSGLGIAASVATYCIVCPLCVGVSYVSMASKDVIRIDAREKCGIIREYAATVDGAAVVQAQLGRLAEGIQADMTTRSLEEAKIGRTTTRPSKKDLPQPVANAFMDGARAAATAAEEFQKADPVRSQKLRDLAAIADRCEQQIANSKKWSKGGIADVIASYDQASTLARELAIVTPVVSARTLADSLRKINLSAITDFKAADEVRTTARLHAERLERELAALPRMPEPMPPATPVPVIAAAFDQSKLQSLYPLLMISILCEMGSPLAWIFAYLSAGRRSDDDDDQDGDSDSLPQRPNGRARSLP